MRAIAKMTAVTAFIATFSCAATSRDSGRDRARDIARACTELSDAEAANAMATIKGSVESVQSKYETVFYPKGSPAQRLGGAVIYVRATPGTTAQWLTRVLTCHELRHVPALCAAKDRCPLAVEGAQVSTTETSMGFAVAIESKDPDIAQEIVRRSRELAPTTSP